MAQLRTTPARFHAGATLDHHELAALASLIGAFCREVAQLAELLEPSVNQYHRDHPIQVQRARGQLENLGNAAKIAQRAAESLRLWSAAIAPAPRRRTEGAPRGTR